MTYNREEVVAFWKGTNLENKHKRREIERLAKLTGSHVDHIKPLKLGGPDLWFNLQVLSGTRNLSKGADFPEVDRKEYQKKWDGLDEAYRVNVQAAIDGNPQPVPNTFERARKAVSWRTRRKGNRAPKAGTLARFVYDKDREHKALMRTQEYRDLLQRPEAKEAITEVAKWRPGGKLYGIATNSFLVAAVGTLFSFMCLIGLTDSSKEGRDTALKYLLFTAPVAFVGGTSAWKCACKESEAKDKASNLGIHFNDYATN